MESLSLALAALGGAVLVAMFLYGRWQQYRAELAQAASLAEPCEPAIKNETAQATRPAELDRPGVRRLNLRIEELIDAIVVLTLESPISGDMILAHYPPTRRAGSKPFLIEGKNAESGVWTYPVAGQRYSQLQAAVQLANRSGPLNEIEYSEFVQKIEGFADAVGAMPDFPDMLDVVARARDLDAFASQHDAQLAVHLRGRSSTWSVGYIHRHAARLGFVLGLGPGRLVLPSQEEGAPPILTLTFESKVVSAEDPNQAAIREVTLSFDVPQTAPTVQPFYAWQNCAEALALGMDADIVDDKGQTFNESGFKVIGEELGHLYRALEAHDLMAGSKVTRRLFS